MKQRVGEKKKEGSEINKNRPIRKKKKKKLRRKEKREKERKRGKVGTERCRRDRPGARSVCRKTDFGGRGLALQRHRSDQLSYMRPYHRRY